MSKIARAFELVNEKGISYVLKRAVGKLLGERIQNYQGIRELFTGKSGLEVGGPSKVFQAKGFVPLYDVIQALDGCNFSTSTIWEGNILSGEKYQYQEGKEGVQYIMEAADLSLIPDAKYEFVISSNCLEHVANPLKAIEEWTRVLKKEGLLLVVVPNKEYCFDHKRATTPYTHILEDYQQGTHEDDMTHLEEILEFHDVSKDPGSASMEFFKERSLKNYENRALHHHVFDNEVLQEMLHYFDLEVLQKHEGLEFIILARKKSD